VRQRHVASAAIEEFLDVREVSTDRKAVLDPDEDDSLAGRMNAARIGGGDAAADGETRRWGYTPGADNDTTLRTRAS
jgi:hypothetical protein